jgi:hypothetical protein
MYMSINNKNKDNFTIDGIEIENVDIFPYLGSIVTKEGGSMEDVRNKISKENEVFNQLQKVWKSSDISLRTKLRIYNSNVISILRVLYGCKTWRITQEICKTLQSFVNRCLRRIAEVRWSLTITNDEL